MAITPIDQKGRAKAISDDIIPLEWKFRTNSRKTIIDRVIRRSGEGPHTPYGALGSPTRLFSLFWQSPCLFRSSDPTGAFLILPSFGGSSLSGLWYAPRHVARKMITGSPSASLPYTVEMSEDGLNFRTSASESRLTWDLITGWAEVDRVFALFPSPISFLPIPKRALAHDQQDELRTLLQRKVSHRT